MRRRGFGHPVRTANYLHAHAASSSQLLSWLGHPHKAVRTSILFLILCSVKMFTENHMRHLLGGEAEGPARGQNPFQHHNHIGHVNHVD